MKEKIFKLLQSIVIASIISFAIYIVAGLINHTFYHTVKNSDLVWYSFMMILYTVSFYFDHFHRNEERFSPEERFNIFKEAKYYFKNEGKYLLLIYSVLSFLCECNCLLKPESPELLIPTLCLMVFPFLVYIPIPVLRTLISLLLANVIPLILVEIRSFIIYREKKKWG